MFVVPTFEIEQSPETGSVCPILHFTEPIKSGDCRPVTKTLSKECTSSGSPTLVPKHKDGVSHKKVRFRNSILLYQFRAPQ